MFDQDIYSTWSNTYVKSRDRKNLNTKDRSTCEGKRQINAVQHHPIDFPLPPFEIPPG